MSPAKALRLALAQAGEDLLGSSILTGTVEEARTTVPQMTDLIGDGALVMLLQGSNRSRGLAILDAGALTAVIEALTTGRISAGEPPAQPRMPTATDAFLSGRFLTRIVSAFSDYLNALPETDWAGEFTATEQVRDARSLPLLLDDLAFRAITAPLDFDAGARQGQLRLVLPWGSSRTALKALPAPDLPAEDSPPAAGQTDEALQALLQGETSLEAILHRQRLPLSSLLRWKAGDLMSFPAHAIASVALVDAAGDTIATTRLGQANGQRAVKLTDNEPKANRGLSPLAMAAARTVGGRAPLGDPSEPESDPTPASAEGSAFAAADGPDPAKTGQPGEQADPSDLPPLPSVIE